MQSDYDVIRATEQSQTSYLPRLSQPLSVSEDSDLSGRLSDSTPLRLDSHETRYNLARSRNLSRTTGLLDYLTDKSSEVRKYSEIHNQDI